jgi:hypothetical protein
LQTQSCKKFHNQILGEQKWQIIKRLKNNRVKTRKKKIKNTNLGDRLTMNQGNRRKIRPEWPNNLRHRKPAIPDAHQEKPKAKILKNKKPPIIKNLGQNLPVL